MRATILVTALALGLVRASAAHASPEEWITGSWIGGFHGREGPVSVAIEFGRDGDRLVGRLDLPLKGEHNIPLERVSASGSKARFEVRGSSANVLFEGRVEGQRLAGSVRHALWSAGFELYKVAALDRDRIEAVAGNFELEPGRVVLIARSPSGLIYVDEDGGRVGVLYAMDERTLVGGPSIAAGYPFELTIQLGPVVSGRVERLTWEQKGRRAVDGVRRAFYRSEQIGFYNGDIRLSGTLVLPNRPGPHPAVVMIHGSGPATRDGLRPWADVYARAGIAVLIHDKRGTGASTGSWTRATFDDLAGDALAGIAYLQSRPEIDRRQIGLHGMSLGSWVAPLAAQKSPSVAFIIAESAPALTPLEHERFRVEHQLRADGFSSRDVAAAQAFMEEKFEVARTGRGWARLQRRMEDSAAEAWFTYVNPPSSLESLVWHWKHVLSYDPVPALETLACPVLVLYGELDSVVPASVHRDRMAAVLQRSRTRDVTIRVVEDANHAFLAAGTGGSREMASLRGFVDGYLGTHAEWLNARIARAPATASADEALAPQPVGSAGPAIPHREP